MPRLKQTKAEKEEKFQHVFRLWTGGARLSQIIAATGYPEKTVKACIRRAKDESAARIADLDAERAQDLEVLTANIVHAVARYQAREVGAGDLIRLLERKARMLGLDAPSKSDVTSGGKPVSSIIVHVVDDGNPDHSQAPP